jgi:hypothetical protein
MSPQDQRNRRNYLRKAIKHAEAERAEWRAKHPADSSGDHDRAKHIGFMARELRGIGGGDLSDPSALDRTD